MTDWEGAYKELVAHTQDLLLDHMPMAAGVYKLLSDMIVARWTVHDVETKPEPKN